MKRYILLLLVMFATFFGSELKAQEWALKSNLAYDATASINLGVEIGIAEKWTLDFSGNYNPFTINKDTNKKWKHWLVQPEARYWFCHKFGGHFLAMHLWGGQYNVGNIDNFPTIGANIPDFSSYRFEGYFAGAGIGYGYAWMLGNHWNLEAQIGIGGAYSWYDKFFCPKCGEKVSSDNIVYWGITKLAINIVYVF